MNNLCFAVRQDLASVRRILCDSIQLKNDELTTLLREMLQLGKWLRPTLTLLCGRMLLDKSTQSVTCCETQVVDKLIRMAASIEAVHAASMIHDDIIDGSLMRRGLSTIHAVWGYRVAVLVGDYFYAKSAQLASSTENCAIMKILAKAVEELSNGEIEELLDREATHRTLEQAEQRYIAIVHKKTAALTAAACESGSVIVGGSGLEHHHLREFGLRVGTALQIIDDLLDITAQGSVTGKDVQSDLKAGILTLPIIYAIEELSLSGDSVPDLLAMDPAIFIEALKRTRALDRSLKRALWELSEAKHLLGIFPVSPFRLALEEAGAEIVMRLPVTNDQSPSTVVPNIGKC